MWEMDTAVGGDADDDPDSSDSHDRDSRDNAYKSLRERTGYINLKGNGLLKYNDLGDITQLIANENGESFRPEFSYRVGVFMKIIFHDKHSRDMAVKNRVSIEQCRVEVEVPRDRVGIDDTEESIALHLFDIDILVPEAEVITFLNNYNIIPLSPQRFLCLKKDRKVKSGGRAFFVKKQKGYEIPGRLVFKSAFLGRSFKIKLWYPNMGIWCDRCSNKGHKRQQCQQATSEPGSYAHSVRNNNDTNMRRHITVANGNSVTSPSFFNNGTPAASGTNQIDGTSSANRNIINNNELSAATESQTATENENAPAATGFIINRIRRANSATAGIIRATTVTGASTTVNYAMVGTTMGPPIRTIVTSVPTETMGSNTVTGASTTFNSAMAGITTGTPTSTTVTSAPTGTGSTVASPMAGMTTGIPGRTNVTSSGTIESITVTGVSTTVSSAMTGTTTRNQISTIVNSLSDGTIGSNTVTGASINSAMAGTTTGNPVSSTVSSSSAGTIGSNTVTGASTTVISTIAGPTKISPVNTTVTNAGTTGTTTETASSIIVNSAYAGFTPGNLASNPINQGQIVSTTVAGASTTVNSALNGTILVTPASTIVNQGHDGTTGTTTVTGVSTTVNPATAGTITGNLAGIIVNQGQDGTIGTTTETGANTAVNSNSIIVTQGHDKTIGTTTVTGASTTAMSTLTGTISGCPASIVNQRHDGTSGTTVAGVRTTVNQAPAGTISGTHASTTINQRQDGTIGTTTVTGASTTAKSASAPAGIITGTIASISVNQGHEGSNGTTMGTGASTTVNSASAGTITATPACIIFNAGQDRTIGTTTVTGASTTVNSAPTGTITGTHASTIVNSALDGTTTEFHANTAVNQGMIGTDTVTGANIATSVGTIGNTTETNNGTPGRSSSSVSNGTSTENVCEEKVPGNIYSTEFPILEAHSTTDTDTGWQPVVIPKVLKAYSGNQRPFLRFRDLEKKLYFSKYSTAIGFYSSAPNTKIYSNWHRCNIEIDGVVYSSVEKYMFICRAEMTGQSELADEMRKLDDPSSIKALGKKVIWPAGGDSLNQWTFDILYAGNRAKYVQHADLRRCFFATVGRRLVETNPNKSIWGIGVPFNNPKAFSKPSMWGAGCLNWFGDLLTMLRLDLIDDNAFANEAKEAFSNRTLEQLDGAGKTDRWRALSKSRNGSVKRSASRSTDRGDKVTKTQ